MAASMSSYGDDEGLISDINVTPLVDVVLVILIVFMITVPTMVKMKMVQEKELNLELPTAGAAQPLTVRTTDVTINVLQMGDYFLEGEPVTLELLTSRLKQLEADNPHRVSVVIRADRRVVWQHVMTALNACNKEGIHNCRVMAVD